MKITIDVAKLDDDRREIGRQEMTFEQIGSEAWVRVGVGGAYFDVDYREFWAAARSACIDSVQ